MAGFFLATHHQATPRAMICSADDHDKSKTQSVKEFHFSVGGCLIWDGTPNPPASHRGCTLLLCCAASFSSMRESEHSPENLLRRLNDRDVEMSVLLQRVGILLETPPKEKDATCLDRHATRVPARDAGSEADDGCDLAKGGLHVQTANKAGSLEALKACLARMCRSQQQVSGLHGGRVTQVTSTSSTLWLKEPLHSLCVPGM